MTTGNKIKHAVAAGLCAAVAITCALSETYQAAIGFAAASVFLLREVIKP